MGCSEGKQIPYVDAIIDEIEARNNIIIQEINDRLRICCKSHGFRKSGNL